jgi:hypothetical protein
MSIFQRIPADQIKEDFTHYGLFCGLVPVYYRDMPPDGCLMAVRNWWPEWLMDFAEVIFGLCVNFRSAMDPDYDPQYPIKLTGEISR